MKRATTISISIVVLALLSGCTARSLSVLQTEFNAAVEARATCPPEEAYEPAAASNCSVDYQTIFSDIAAQAEKSLNEYKGGPAVKMDCTAFMPIPCGNQGPQKKPLLRPPEKG